jgi:hypothetical protein
VMNNLWTLREGSGEHIMPLWRREVEVFGQVGVRFVRGKINGRRGKEWHYTPHIERGMHIRTANKEEKRRKGKKACEQVGIFSFFSFSSFFRL